MFSDRLHMKEIWKSRIFSKFSFSNSYIVMSGPPEQLVFVEFLNQSNTWRGIQLRSENFFLYFPAQVFVCEEISLDKFALFQRLSAQVALLWVTFGHMRRNFFACDIFWFILLPEVFVGRKWEFLEISWDCVWKHRFHPFSWIHFQLGPQLKEALFESLFFDFFRNRKFCIVKALGGICSNLQAFQKLCAMFQSGRC